MNILKMYKLSWYIPTKKSREKFRNFIYNKWLNLNKINALEIQVADHCNFSCYSCSHFSQLADENFYDIDIFTKDIKRLSEITNTCIKEIRVMGGEPLLNDRCHEYFTVIRKYFPYTSIILVTNGILLTKQSDIFWQSMHDNNVYLSPTKYPIKLDVDKIIELSNKYKVNFQYWGGAEDDYIKESFTSGFDIEGKQDPKVSFEKCRSTCFQLKNGKFYVCPDIAYIDYFNKYFNVSLEVTDNDFLDIYKSTMNDILIYINTPKPFCKYCVEKFKVIGHWRTSKNNIDEYLYYKNFQN